MKTSAKPLPARVRSAIAQAALFHVLPERPVELVVKSHHNKQLVLALVEGPFVKTLLRLHKKLHRQFYQIVAAAKKLLATLIREMATPVSAPVALLPATCASSTVAAALSEASGSQLWRTHSNPVGSIDMPISRFEARAVKTSQMALARHNQMVSAGLR